MVDYSKWDNFAYNESDEERCEFHHFTSFHFTLTLHPPIILFFLSLMFFSLSEDDDRPTVTRLEDGAKVKIGPKGATAMNPSGRFTDFAAPNQDSTPPDSGLSTSFPPSSTTSSVSTAAAVPPAIKKGPSSLHFTTLHYTSLHYFV